MYVERKGRREGGRIDVVMISFSSRPADDDRLAKKVLYWYFSCG